MSTRGTYTWISQKGRSKFKHYGIHKEHFQIRIAITTRETANGSEIIVEDNGPGFELRDEDNELISQGPSENETRIGLNNVRERLQLMCGGSLTASLRPEGGTVVTIFIPK